MRDPADWEREALNEAYAATALEDIDGWQLVTGYIRGRMEAATAKVLNGIESNAEYWKQIGFISALDEILSYPGELVERGVEVRESLNV